ncbi:hypothetical protein ACOSQ2_014624 [Xanthoceras sorbifolium]
MRTTVPDSSKSSGDRSPKSQDKGLKVSAENHVVVEESVIVKGDVSRKSKEARDDRRRSQAHESNAGKGWARSRVSLDEAIGKVARDGGSLNKWGSRFHFEEAWVNDEDCKKIVEVAWDAGFGTNVISRLNNSVGMVSDYLQSWNRARRKAIGLELKNLKK